MAKNCNTSPFYLQGQSPTIQNQVAIIERFLKKQLPNYAVITISLNGVDVPKDEFGNVDLAIETIKGDKGDKGDPGEKGDKGDKGDPGINGIDGKDGEDGADGIDGSDGADGKSAYEIWIEQGHTGTEEDFLNWLREGEYLKQIQNLDDYEGEIGEIVQYKGETNSKYTNGYIYKKVGTQTIIPVGTEYINIGNRWTVHGFPECGIVPDIYYKTDKTDAISENIMKTSAWRYVTQSGGVNVYSDGADFKVRIGSIGVYWISGSENRFQIRQVESVSYSTYQGVSYPRSIRLENGLGDELQADTRQPIVPSFYLPSEITIFESLDGKKIYCYESNGQYYVLPLDFDGEHYQAIPYALVINDNNEYYIYGTTQESIDIDTTEWQQWDVQPRDDTSHFVTDSEIGWIEH